MVGTGPIGTGVVDSFLFLDFGLRSTRVRTLSLNVIPLVEVIEVSDGSD